MAAEAGLAPEGRRGGTTSSGSPEDGAYGRGKTAPAVTSRDRARQLTSQATGRATLWFRAVTNHDLPETPLRVRDGWDRGRIHSGTARRGYDLVGSADRDRFARLALLSAPRAARVLSHV